MASSSAQGQLLELSPATALLTDDSPSIFRNGFYTPSLAHMPHQSVPWSSVQEVMLMARDALKAKQRAAERLAREVESLRQAGGSDKLLARAQRAEVDSGSLLGELQQLIQAKADVAQQRADLDRSNALLMAERQLLCEQLQVSPDNVNLCHAVSKVLAAARRAKALDSQLRLLAKFQRELLLQLEAQREEGARAARQWQAREQVYLRLLASHGIAAPQMEGGAPVAAAAGAAAAAAPEQAACGGGSVADAAPAASDGGAALSRGGSSSNGSAALLTQLMLMRMASGNSFADGMDIAVGSPAQTAHMLPPTPPVHDMLPPPPPPHRLGGSPPPPPPMRRSHSLDSSLNSLTGLLDQLALGQLGGCGELEEGGCEYLGCGPFDECERDSDGGWMPADSWLSSDSSEPRPCAGAAGVGMAASLSCKGQDQQQQQQQQQPHHHHLQPVQELPEEAAAA